MSIIGSMLAGGLAEGGKAGEAVGSQMLKFSNDSDLKNQEAEIQKLRDERLHQSAVAMAQLNDELRRAPAEKAAAEIADKNKPVFVDDGRGGGSYQSPTKSEKRANIRDAMMKSGSETLIGNALHADLTEEGYQVQREGQSMTASTAEKQITSNERISAEQIKSHEKIAKASNAIALAANGIAAGHLQLSKERDNIDNALKVVQYQNSQDLRDLQDQYQVEKDPRKKAEIKGTIQTLTGKDNDNYIPVPTGFDENTGKPNAYQIFDKKSGTFVQTEKAGGGPAIGTVDEGYRFKGGDYKNRANWEPVSSRGTGIEISRLPPLSEPPGTPKEEVPREGIIAKKKRELAEKSAKDEQRRKDYNDTGY